MKVARRMTQREKEERHTQHTHTHTHTQHEHIKASNRKKRAVAILYKRVGLLNEKEEEEEEEEEEKKRRRTSLGHRHLPVVIGNNGFVSEAINNVSPSLIDDE
jgi:hypothetical protein